MARTAAGGAAAARAVRRQRGVGAAAAAVLAAALATPVEPHPTGKNRPLQSCRRKVRLVLGSHCATMVKAGGVGMLLIGFDMLTAQGQSSTRTRIFGTTSTCATGHSAW